MHTPHRLLRALAPALLLLSFATLPACRSSVIRPGAGADVAWYVDPSAPASAPDGVFDRTEVLIAFHSSQSHADLINSLIRQRDAALAAGDHARARELEQQGAAMQDRAHRQLAGTAPLDNIAAALHKDLPAIARAAGVARIFERGGEIKGRRTIDVTAAMVERLPAALNAGLKVRYAEIAVDSLNGSEADRGASLLLSIWVGERSGDLYDLHMPQISTFLTFNDQAEQAARFYTSIFPNSKITRITRYPDLGPKFPIKAGSVMTVEFTLDGRAFTALNGGPSFTFTQGFSIAVICDTQEQVDEYWGKFAAAGGKPVACGWITDHFGVSWQIDPKLLIDLIGDPDPAKAAKAMQAMMTMVKIDSEQIRRAVAE